MKLCKVTDVYIYAMSGLCVSIRLKQPCSHMATCEAHAFCIDCSSTRECSCCQLLMIPRFAPKCQLVEERCNASYLNQCVNRHMWNVSHVMQIIEYFSSLILCISFLSLRHGNNFLFVCSPHTILLVPKRVYVCSRRRRPADRAFV